MNYNDISEVFHRLEKSPINKKVFLEFQGKKYLYKDFLTDVRKMATRYQIGGLKQGHRVFVSVSGDYDFCLIFMSLLRCGLTPVVLDPNANPSRAKAILKTADVQALILEDHLFQKWELETDAVFNIKIKRETRKKGSLFKKLLKKSNANSTIDSSNYPAFLETTVPLEQLPERIEEDALAYILFTSGTTSSPKGVMISHRNLWEHMATLSKVYQLNSSFRMLNILNLYHTDGITQGVLLAAYVGGTLVRPFQKFEISRIGDLFLHIYKSRTTHFIVSPTMLTLMLKLSEGFEDSFDTPDFDFVISSSAKLESGLWEQFEKSFNTKIVNVYGLTETVSGSLYSKLDTKSRKIGTVGMPIDCEAKIVDENGREVGANEKGELILKGPHITKGYFNNPDATAVAIRDGWFFTGDIAIRDIDGYYSICGRKKNMLNIGGVSIYPEEVIEIINTHPEVLENVCIGMEDEVFGEKLICCIVKKEGSGLDKFKLTAWLRDRIESSKVPADIIFMQDFPKTISMKVDLNKLKEQIKNKNSLNSAKVDNYLQAVFNAASEAFKIPVGNLNIEDNNNTLEGWDSMAHLIFVTNLEAEIGVRFSTAEILVMNSLKNASNILTKKMQVQ